MATTAFLNFLRNPHGRTVDGINYERVKCIVCPKCWLKFIYQYIIFLLMLIATWFAIKNKNIGASLVIVVFLFVFLTISEILAPRFLPGTIMCQDIPFPPQLGENIKFLEFICLVFRYTSEESKERFLKVETGVEQLENETESGGGLFIQSGPKNNNIHLDESIESLYYRQEFEDTMLHQRGSKNNLLHLDESTESLCNRQQLEELEYEDTMLHKSGSKNNHPDESTESVCHRQQLKYEGTMLSLRGSKNNRLHLDESIENVCHRQELEGDHELEDLLLRRTLSKGELATETHLRHRPLFKNGLFRRQLSEGEYGLNLLRRQFIKNNLLHRPLSEGESTARLFLKEMFEGGLIHL